MGARQGATGLAVTVLGLQGTGTHGGRSTGWQHRGLAPHLGTQLPVT